MEISVIIPVYNTARYLRRCIESVLNQSYRDYEIIIINDGSTDNSLEIAIEILKGRRNAMVISQENQGVSAARNHGIRLASGTYVTFVDSDDYVEEHYLETLINECSGKDYLVAGLLSYANGKKVSEVIPFNISWTIEELKAGRFECLEYTSSPVSRLYKKSIIDNNHIVFEHLLAYAEDRDFNIEYIKYIQTAKYISYAGYLYTVDVVNSLSKKYNSNRLKNDCIYWKKMYHLFNASCTQSESIHKYLTDRLMYFIVDNIAEMSKYYSIKYIHQITQNAIQSFDYEYLKCHVDLLQSPMWQRVSLLLGSNVFTFNIVLFYKIRSILHLNT